MKIGGFEDYQHSVVKTMETQELVWHWVCSLGRLFSLGQYAAGPVSHSDNIEPM